jgi:cell wall-associated NlpC family hydrolase
VAAEDQGEIVAVVQSAIRRPTRHHPKLTALPAKNPACRGTSSIPRPNNGVTASLKAFELPYVGREFVFGVVDCYTLCRDWYNREFGLNLNDYDRRDKFWLRGENLYLDNFAKEGFYPSHWRSCNTGMQSSCNCNHRCPITPPFTWATN